MKRITKKEKWTLLNPFEEIYKYKVKYTYEAVDKLGALEDIEEEINIDLVTLFNAMKNGIYVKYLDKIDHFNYVRIEYDELNKWWHICFSEKYGGELYVIDVSEYGKTWALTEEELK